MLRSLSIYALIFFVAFNILSFIRESKMLSDDELITKMPHTLSTLMSEQVTLAAEDKITVIYFFAPWCKVCHISIDNLQALYLKNPHIDVIAVALDYQNKQEIVDFNKQHQLTFPIALGNAKVKQDFKVAGYPSYYVLDENNLVTGKSLGYSTELGLYLRTL